MANAGEARKVVFELFQDLDRFSLDDYQPFADIEQGQARIFAFFKAALEQQGGSVRTLDEERFAIHSGDGAPVLTGTLNRDLARADEHLELIGLDHPLVTDFLEKFRRLSPDEIGAAVTDTNSTGPCALSLWLVRAQRKESESITHIVALAVDRGGQRMPSLEKRHVELLHRPAGNPVFTEEEREALLRDVLDPMLQRELQHRGLASQSGGYSAELIGWVEMS